MKREKIAILPTLYDFGGDMSPENKWYVQYSVKDPATGQMVRKKLYAGFAKIKDKKSRYAYANTLIKEYTDKLTAGWNPYIHDKTAIYTDMLQYRNAARIFQDKKSGNKNINFYINKHLAEQFSGLDPNTISTYTSKYRIFQLWAQKEGFSEYDISGWDNGMIKQFFHFLNSERQVSKVTYGKYKQLIFGLFENLYDNGKISVNPVQKLPKCTRVVDKGPQPIMEEDILTIMEKLKEQPQMYLFVLFEYYCLMRPNEIRLMKVSWIDFYRKIIRIPPEISKTRRPKTPIIPDAFMRVLRDIYELHLVDKDLYVIGKHDEKPGSEHLGKNTMRTRFNVLLKKLKMPVGYMLYSWKHLANVRLESSDFSSYDRMMQNGHTSITTTERYTRLKTGFKSERVEREYPVL